MDELRWLKPVFPGDVLRCESEVLEVTPSRSRPGMGVVRTRMTVLNQHDERVMTLVPIALYRRRPGEERNLTVSRASLCVDISRTER